MAAAVALKEFILLIWKSQTYFGQLYVCVWLLSYLAMLIGMEILHSIDNNLICNYTLAQPNVHVMCPEYDNSRLQRRSTFIITYGVVTFAIWFLYTAYSVPRLKKFRTHQILTPLCNLYVAYFVQLFAKLLVHFLMLFIHISLVQFWFPVRLHCSLQNITDPDMKPKGNTTCTDKYRVQKAIMQTTLLTVLAVLTLISFVELVYILHMMRSRSRTVFVGDEGHRREPLDNGCLCSCVIPTDRQFILFRLHLRRIDPEPENESENLLAKYFEDMKNFYLEKTEYVDNFHLANTGVLKLDDIFTKPVITEARRPNSSAKNSCVQKKSTENAEDISNFLLTGKAGMGKTTFAQKIIRQWAKGESGLSNQIKIVLSFDFNGLEDAKCTVSLKELIRNQIPLEFIDFVKGYPSAILIVVDNVGESKTEDQETDFENTFEEVMPFPVMLKKFITGKLLKGATIIALSRLSHINYSELFGGAASQTEIVGFSPQSIKEYIKRYFSSSGAVVDLDRLMLMEGLTDEALSICCVPSNCFYMCSFLKWLRYPDKASVVEKGGSIPDSLTRLYIAVMQMISPIRKQSLCSGTASNSIEALPSLKNSSVQLSEEESSTNGTTTTEAHGSSHRLAFANHGAKQLLETQCTPRNLPNIRSGVCSLAMRSIDERRVTFTLDELRSVLSDEDVPIYFRPIEPDKDGQETHFSFRWGYLQEFLAAHFTVSDYSLTRFESLVKQVKENISSKRDQVLQFACGLLFELSQFSDKTKKEAIHHITELDNASQPCKRRQKELQLVMIKCVAEVKDCKLSREVASKFIPVIEFPCCDIGVAECSALANVLGTSPFASIRSIDLSDNKMSVMGIRQLTQKLLLPGKGPTEELNVKGNTLGDQGLKELTEALKKKECRLKILNVADNGITTAGVSKLSSALNSNTCLEELNLSYNEICREGVAQLATALRKEKTKVSRLNLGYNNIEDEGVASLESVRQSSLNLARNNITINGIHSLVSLFPTLTNLEELDLSGNIIESVGLEALLPCLMIPGCRIKCLGFNFCKLLDEGVVHCAKILTFSHNQITSLSLTGNGITNDGVDKIAQAFASPECKVKCLNLSSNRIGDEGVEALSLSLGSPNCDLQELDLSRNLIENKGCKCLTVAIRKRNCLQRLALQGNKVGDEGATSLLSAIRIHNCKLHSLILDENDISDEGISGLPHAFSSPHCKLGSLKLRKNLISRNSLETLTEAMNSPFCRLEQLALGESI